MNHINNFYTIYNKDYISLKDLNTLKLIYRGIKTKKNKSFIERSFLHEYKKLDKLISIKNNNYLLVKRNNTKILDDIHGYKLDEYQSKIVLSKEESSLVIAGAGSGKSLTIIGKIIYLIKEEHIKPEEILCISLTNDATNNLRKNIYNYYHINIPVYTFHKLALLILKSNNENYYIAEDNLLEETINNYFKYNINNRINKKAYKYLIKNTKELNNIKRLILTFINLFKANNYDLSYFKIILHKIKFKQNYKRNKYLLLFIINIYLIYENILKNENLIDFNDMICKCITSLKEKGLIFKWKYIIIDEYQDTSETKFQMIKEIIRITNAKFLAVGDDFQSIYRFTGCNLKIFLNFTSYFDNSKIFKIINTYRNPQELIDVAGKFIMKNKYQYKKNLISNKHLIKPIKIIYTKNYINTLKYLLEQLKDKEIMVIGRNNNDIYNYIDNTFTKKYNNIFTFNNINFIYLTAHRSKGLECDNIILINLEDSYIGFPTKIKDEKILKYVNNTKDYYPYEEERRLFYVALTRTKNNTYIISSYNHESIFTKELKKYKKDVEIIKNNYFMV